ncbi:MAG TPA: YbaY family lipoprotein, partial [Leptolyngbyaceae cyanobacterium M65_K2018_010]|nr:YbaY family lipoprotein [Leptolyngbyaceae cyanobacterium M65_K2018_010]
APAITLASQSMITGGRQVPISFELVYDPTQIEQRFSYAVQARITVDGQLRFINTTRFPVITQGHPSQVEVRVEPVGR